MVQLPRSTWSSAVFFLSYSEWGGVGSDKVTSGRVQAFEPIKLCTVAWNCAFLVHLSIFAVAIVVCGKKEQRQQQHRKLWPDGLNYVNYPTKCRREKEGIEEKQVQVSCPVKAKRTERIGQSGAVLRAGETTLAVWFFRCECKLHQLNTDRKFTSIHAKKSGKRNRKHGFRFVLDTENICFRWGTKRYAFTIESGMLSFSLHNAPVTPGRQNKKYAAYAISGCGCIQIDR